MAAKQYKRKDHLYQRAKQEGYRSRAAYKLLELDKKFSLFRKGMCVVDLGCFPGGWLQVAAGLVGPSGHVLGIDLQDVEPLALDYVDIVKGDFCDPDVQDELSAGLPKSIDMVISDLSPSLSGIKLRDALQSADLVERAFYFSMKNVRKGGHFVAKIFPGHECEQVVKEIRPHFETFKRINLASTRSSSKEMYLVARQKR